MSKLLILVPTYNERNNVRELAERILRLAIPCELLFVDDNSQDGTPELLHELARQYPQIHLLQRPGKLGIGSAHLDGIRWAYHRGFQTLVTMDGDLSHSPEDIPRLLMQAAHYDMVVGSRWLRKGSLPGWSLFRRFLTNLGHVLTYHLLRMPYDATNAFRVYRLDRVPREVFDLVVSRSYSFFFESLFLLHKNHVRIGEVSISLPARTYGSSKMRWRDAFYSARFVWKLRLRSFLNPRSIFLAHNPRPAEQPGSNAAA